MHMDFYHIYYEALKLRVRSMYEKILTYLVAIVPGLANELLELLWISKLREEKPCYHGDGN